MAAYLIATVSICFCASINQFASVPLSGSFYSYTITGWGHFGCGNWICSSYRYIGCASAVTTGFSITPMFSGRGVSWLQVPAVILIGISFLPPGNVLKDIKLSTRLFIALELHRITYLLLVGVHYRFWMEIRLIS